MIVIYIFFNSLRIPLLSEKEELRSSALRTVRYLIKVSNEK